MSINKLIKFDVFIDYTCPWVRQAGMWLAMVKEELGEDLQINWRSFALEQVNSTQGDNWKAW